MGRTDSEMTLDVRIMAKDLTVYMVTVRTMGACQVKNRESVPEKRRMLKICLFGKDSRINVSETLLSCFWLFFERFSKWKSFLPNCFFLLKLKLCCCALTHKEEGQFRFSTCKSGVIMTTAECQGPLNLKNSNSSIWSNKRLLYKLKGMLPPNLASVLC